MNLSDRQAAVAQRLDVGEAIVQAGGRDPCPVQLDHFDLEKTISDTVLWKQQRPAWDALSAEPRVTPDALAQQATDTAADKGAAETHY